MNSQEDDQREHLPDLIDRARDGCSQAAEELYKRYSGIALRVIRYRLAGPVRRRFESDDVLQSVWKTVFTKVLQSETFDSPHGFLAFLIRVAELTTDAVNRHSFRQKRNLGQEVPLDDEHAAQLPDPGSLLEQVDCEDEWRHDLASLPEACREAVVLLREGRPLQHIADHLGVSVRTLYRRFELARRHHAAREAGESEHLPLPEG